MVDYTLRFCQAHCTRYSYEMRPYQFLVVTGAQCGVIGRGTVRKPPNIFNLVCTRVQYISFVILAIGSHKVDKMVTTPHGNTLKEGMYYEPDRTR